MNKNIFKGTTKKKKQNKVTLDLQKTKRSKEILVY